MENAGTHTSKGQLSPIILSMKVKAQFVIIWKLIYALFGQWQNACKDKHLNTRRGTWIVIFKHFIFLSFLSDQMEGLELDFENIG